MHIHKLYNLGKPVISFEVFPPKADAQIETIFETLDDLKHLNPDFISVTYGAGGSNSDRTLEIASKIINDYKVQSMAHVTTIGHSKETILQILSSLKENNVLNILALRGDPPLSQPNFNMKNNAFKYANELISFIREQFGNTFSISAACYPEGHVDSIRIKTDIDNLKQKVDSGVDLLITQLFFDNRIFYDFLDKLKQKNISCPVTPGIMPIYKAEQIKRIASLCGASIPAKLVLLMDKFQDNPDDLRKAGIEYASRQITDLLENDVDGIHLLTMNRAKSTEEILKHIR